MAIEAFATRVAGYAHADRLVSRGWVAAHRDDPSVRLIHVDGRRAAIGAEALPGAVKLDWRVDLRDPIRRDVVNREGFETAMVRKGVANDTTVVLCGEGTDPSATHVFWLLALYGHPDVRITDGERIGWEQEGSAWSHAVAAPRPAAYTAPEPDLAIRAYRDEVFRQMEAGRPLIDVRSPPEYRGEPALLRPMADRGRSEGHVPGARNVPWSRALNRDGTFRDAAELRALYQGEADIWPDEEVICYSESGEASSHTWFVLTYLLGYPHVKNYDGSWSEWGNLVAAPIER